MSYYTCDGNGEINTLNFADGMVIMYDTNYREALKGGLYPTESQNYTDISGIYTGHLPKGWKFLSNVKGPVRGVNPAGNADESFTKTVVNQTEIAEKNLSKLEHRHGVIRSGVNDTTDKYIKGRSGAERLNFSEKVNYAQFTEDTLYDPPPANLNIPPMTRIAFLVRSTQ